MKGVCLVKPVVYGNVAKHFGKKREEDGHTHEWTVYLRPYHGEDMSTYVKKVTFKLHESYTTQTRVVTRPPYEVTETGWGEFEIAIKVFFHDPNERPVTLYHILKLFQSSPGTTAAFTTQVIAAGAGTESRKILVAEAYDELVFQEPSASLHPLLLNTPRLSHPKHYTDFDAKKEKTIQAIGSGREIINEELVNIREKIQLAKETLAIFKKKEKEAHSKAANS